LYLYVGGVALADAVGAGEHRNLLMLGIELRARSKSMTLTWREPASRWRRSLKPGEFNATAATVAQLWTESHIFVIAVE
jgi:hypothetical protein